MKNGSGSLLTIAPGRYVSYNTKYGAEIYRRSLTILLQCAISELYPKLNIQIGQSIMKGYYFELPKTQKFPAKFIPRVTKRMFEIIENDDIFSTKIVSKEAALQLYKRIGRTDKVRAISYLDHKKIKLVHLRKYFDFVLAECVTGAGCLKTFRIIRYKHGFILQFPVRCDISSLPCNPGREECLYEVFCEGKDWDEILGIHHIPDLNDAIKNGDISTLIKVQEAFHEKKIAAIADEIKSGYPKRKVIFVAGPSASGKTTFIKRLGIQLRANGLCPEEINLDSYFVPRDRTPRTPDGDYDFESLKALDVDYFNKQILSFLDGRSVTLPKYDFKTGKRVMSNIKLKMCDKSVILVEGLHALNPELSKKIGKDMKYKIFVSALSQLFIDHDTRIFTSDTRLMRRIIRDNMFRGYNAQHTIARFPMVRQGEDKYIFPYQKEADVFFNSSLIYEQAVLKKLILKHLKAIKKADEEYYEARRLLKYLEFFCSISAAEVPQNSILREFIGESGFNY